MQQELIFRIFAGDESAHTLINEILDGEEPQPQEIMEGLRTLRALIRDASKDVGSNKARSFTSQASANALSWGAWGANTMTVKREVQRLSDALSLPSLGGLQMQRLGAAQGVIIQGSLLPAANQELKSLYSYITGRRIQGAAALLAHSTDEQPALYASQNELLAWRTVNAFSPTLNGEFISYTW